MEREEAIQELQNCKELIKQDGQDYLDERDIPLLDMAIEALSVANMRSKCEVDAKSAEETIEIKPMEIKGGFHIDDDYKKPPQIIGNVEVVVRCKDCRWWSCKVPLHQHNSHLCRYWESTNTSADDFCSRGERREP